MTELLPLRPYQRDAIIALETDWREGLVRLGVVMATGSGKSQPVDEPVLTPSGWRKIGELAPGDEVTGSNGQPARVTGVFPQGIRPTVTVRFTDATEVRCDTDHLWAVQTRDMKNHAKRRGSPPWRVMTAMEIAKSQQTWYVPVVGPVEYDFKSPLPLDPYTLGVLLGDGGLSVPGQVRLHVRHDIVPLLSLPDGHRITLYRDQGVMGNYLVSSGVGRSANLVMNSLRDLGLHGHTAHGKFIPESYLRASPTDRLALLQGLLDTDGSASGNGVDYVSVSKALADGVAELVRSLGGKCTTSRKQTSWTRLGEKRRGLAYRSYITLPRSLCPFRASRKADALVGRKQFDPVKRIESVRPGPDLECVCIGVDAADHRYVTTGYSVTHNTVIFAHLIAKQHTSPDHKRSLVLVHRDELVNQAVDKLTQIAPHLSVGVVKAKRDEVDAEVIVASVQTLARPHRLERLRDIGLVIVDEVHHVAADSYQTVLRALGCIGRGVRMAGFTATMARSDTRRLGSTIEKVSYSRDIIDLIIDGYLVPVKGRKIEVGGFDLSAIRVTHGDFAEAALGEALEDAGAGQVIAKAYVEHASERAGILFAPTVASAHQMTDDLNEVGISAETVWGAMPLEERRLTLKRFAAGDVQVLCNAMVLTEGYDAPHVSCAVIARPTMSAPLYVQQVGRILRPYPGKTDALVLDVVGASVRHRLANLSDLSVHTRDKPNLEPEDDESILSLVERADYRDERKGASGKLTAIEIDLFAGSRSAWLQTHKGLWFIPTHTSIYFLYPDPDGTYRVVQRTRTGGYARLHAGVDLSYGMAWAASYADEEDSQGGFSIGSRSASWRKRRSKPSEKQIDMAKAIGLEVDPEWGKAELSDAISIHQASKALDKWVKD